MVTTLSGDQGWVNRLVAGKSETEQKQDSYTRTSEQADMKWNREIEAKQWRRDRHGLKSLDEGGRVVREINVV